MSLSAAELNYAQSILDDTSLTKTQRTEQKPNVLNSFTLI
jgi:hypothetical protein